MLQEIRHALRLLVKNPLSTLVSVITLALAIGANTAVFSLVNALLIRPLPYQAPQELVLLGEKFSGQGLDVIPLSAPEYLDYEKETHSFSGIAAFDYVDLIGLVLVAFSSRALGSLLYDVRAFDLSTFALVTFALALVALPDSYIPARRATRADPMIALGRG